MCILLQVVVVHFFTYRSISNSTLLSLLRPIVHIPGLTREKIAMRAPYTYEWYVIILNIPMPIACCELSEDKQAGQAGDHPSLFVMIFTGEVGS